MLRVAAIAMMLSTPAVAQDWGGIDALLNSTLEGSQVERRQLFFPDAATFDAATEGIGIAYAYIEGSAGSMSIAVGYYRKGEAGFVHVGPIRDLFGQDPRDVAFLPGGIELTTTTLRDGEPRCCPTGTTRWRIDRATLVASPAQVN